MTRTLQSTIADTDACFISVDALIGRSAAVLPDRAITTLITSSDRATIACFFEVLYQEAWSVAHTQRVVVEVIEITRLAFAASIVK
jgi:hypothetical protein